MIIGINASFARKPNTGIGQVTINFLKKLIENHELRIMNHEFVLYLEEDLPEDIILPENPASSAGKFRKQVFLPLWKRDDLIRKIWWEKRLLPKKTKKDKCDVFLSLYQSATIFKKCHSERSEESRANIAGDNNSESFIAATQDDKRAKHIMIVHDIIPELFPEYLNNSRKKRYWNLTKKAIQKADKIVAVSSRTEKDLIRHLGIDPAKISINYPDVDEMYKTEVKKSESQKVLKKHDLRPGYILSGGGLEKRKNTDGLIRAYHNLLENNKKTRIINEIPQLVISGKLMPELAPLVTDAEKLIKELNLTQHVKLLDFVPQEDLPALYKNALVFAYPSFYEGFGLPVLEAMNAGTPVITSKNSSLPEIGRDAVLYCNPEDEKDIEMVLRNVILREHVRDELRRRGKERAKYFSWERFVEKMLNLTLSL